MPDVQAASKRSWHRLYYALGAFNVVSVLVAIALGYVAMAGFSKSIDVNARWADRVGEYSELAQAASRANAPGNDVFESGAVEREAARLRTLHADFDRRYLEVTRELMRSTPPQVHAPLLDALGEANAAFGHMIIEAEAIFAAFRRGDRADAGAHMAMMDRQGSLASEALSEAIGVIRALQHEQFVRQEHDAHALRQIQYLLAALVLLIVGGIVAYGRKLSTLFAAQRAVIDARNRDMRLVLDHVDQGLLTIDLTGAMSRERSACIDRWFGAPAAGATLSAHLAPRCRGFAEALALGLGDLRDGAMPAEVVLHQLPRRLSLGGRVYDVAYTPIALGAGAAAGATLGPVIEQLLLVISDVTDAVAREAAEREQRELLQIFQRITVDRRGVEEFLLEAGELVTRLREVRDPIVERRLVHTLKGNCAIYGLASYAALAQQVEDELAETDGGLADAQRGMLVEMWRQTMARVAALLGARRSDTVEVDRDELELAMQLARDPELAGLLESWALEPIERRFDRLAMQAAGLARRLGKPEPQVEIRGDGIRLDPESWTALWAAMVHAVRNAVDHGIEDEETRRQAGKPPQATLRLEAVREAGALVIRFGDDGRGVDWAAVRRRAEALGLPHATEADLAAALLCDGVSTCDVPTDVSGRGVGLAALAQAVAELGGALRVDSERGRGTQLTLRFPERPTRALRRPRSRNSSLIPRFDA